MGTKDFHPQDFVFIAYHDVAMSQEAGRFYPITDEDYHEAMEWAQEFAAWQCMLRSEIAAMEEKMDKIMQRIAEEMPMEEMSVEATERVWKNIKAAL